MTSQVSTINPPQPTDYQVNQLKDIRCLLANLYHFAISHRKHLKTKKGYTLATQESFDPAELNKIQFVLIALLVKFIDKRWEGINLVGTPKIPDSYFLQLQRHTMFEGKPIEDYMQDIKLVTRERRVLKELALRIS